jgi:fatty acid/phospholipid biosynthesis enzyme
LASDRVAGVVQALRADSSLSVLLTGHPDDINTYLESLSPALRQRIECVAASQGDSLD